jgi:hypothetical protein
LERPQLDELPGELAPGVANELLGELCYLAAEADRRLSCH